MLFIEASAKTKEGVQIAFEELVEKVWLFFRLNENFKKILFSFLKILQTPGLWEKVSSGTNLNLNNKNKNQSQGACSYC